MTVRVPWLWPALLVAAGCGPSGPKRYDLSGTVTYQGKPVPVGMVYFEPDVHKKNSGPQGHAEIRQGRFDTAAGEGKGHSGGPMLIRVQGYDGRPREGNDWGVALFPEFSLTTDLPTQTATKDFDVPPK